MRSEMYELHLVYLALEATNPHDNRKRHTMQIINEMLHRKAHANYEQEYVEFGGYLHTRRLITADHIKRELNSRVEPFESHHVSTGDSGRFQIAMNGSADTEKAVCFVEAAELAVHDAESVEVLVKTIPLHSHHFAMLSKGHDEVKSGTEYCSGVVTLAGPKAALQPGDRVFATFSGPLGSHIRASSKAVVKIPDALSFENAALLCPPLVGAYHGLVDICRIVANDWVLVQDGDSIVGQAALLLLHHLGIKNVWVTVSTQDATLWMTREMGIPIEQIVPKSWTDSYGLFFPPKKFDLIFITCEDSSSLILLDLMKSGGRYIQVTPMSSQSAGSSRRIQSPPSSMQLVMLKLNDIQINPEALYEAVAIASNMQDRAMKHHVHHFFPRELAEAFSCLRTMSERETFLLSFNQVDSINVYFKRREHQMLNPDATYVIAGGLGGLGRAMAEWLVARGARHLILLSRSGPRSVNAQQFLEAMSSRNIRVETPQCDITKHDVLKNVLDKLLQSMPPIKGCIQSSMVMRESIFERMTYKDWKETVDPKVQGSWNLHQQLPTDMDFFVFISSMMGILGSTSLTAYNAGNTYCDGLAQYRISKGQKAVAFNLGAVPDGGHLLETSHKRLVGIEESASFAVVVVKELHAMLDIYCDPASPYCKDPVQCQSLIGVRPPAHWKSLQDVPFTWSQPFWGHTHHIPSLPTSAQEPGISAEDKQQRALHAVAKLGATTSLPEATEIASEELAHQVSLLLGIEHGRIDSHKSMHSYGLDSLSAIDLRNWVGKVFDVDLPVFEVLGGIT